MLSQERWDCLVAFRVSTSDGGTMRGDAGVDPQPVIHAPHSNVESITPHLSLLAILCNDRTVYCELPRADVSRLCT